MEEQTGTADELLFDASDMDTVANESESEQAPEEDTGSAVEETNEQSDSQEQATDEPAVESTDNTQTGVSAINEFLAKKGIDPSDPDAVRKIAEMYQNSEKGFYNKSQELAQLQRQLANQQLQQSTPDQQALNEVRALKLQMETEKWQQSHNLTPEDEAKMVEYLSQPLVDRQGNPVINPLTGQTYTRAVLVNNGAMSLDEVYRLADCGVQKIDDLKANLRAEIEREYQARQAAKSPAANATDSTQFAKPVQEDPFVAGLLG